MADAERSAAGIPGPAYAIDDETAIKVVDGTVEVVSEGHWKLSTPHASSGEPRQASHNSVVEPRTHVWPAFRNVP